ncbi:MAG: hypothetical protein ACI9K1_002583, partial [Arcticibacterium sp.]
LELYMKVYQLHYNQIKIKFISNVHENRSIFARA